MAPGVPALAQSESKTRFFQRLKFRDDNEKHRELYLRMKKEAIEGRRRLVEKETSESPINETATHAEILRIYRRASAETKEIYELGRDTDGLEEENWIIRWLLWHAFRYRDQRNNRNRRASSAARNNSGEELDSSGSGGTPCSSMEYSDSLPVSLPASLRPLMAVTAPEPVSRRHGFWDPVRGSWQSQTC